MKKITYSKKGASVFAFFMVGMMFLSCIFTVMLDTINAASIKPVATKGYTLTDAENVDYDFSSKLNQNSVYSTNRIDDDERILAIIEVDGNSLSNNYLTYANSKFDSLPDYVASNSAKGYALNMQAVQENLFNALSQQFDIEFKYSYTSILNGFAAYVRYGDVAAIEQEAKVHNVIISERFSAPEVYSSSGAAENVVEIDPGTGIYDTSSSNNQGHGTIVAVLDTGLDHEHSAFLNSKGDIDFSNPAKAGKYTRSDIQGKLDEERFAAAAFTSGLKAEDVYINEKVPYAYDYADKDPEVFPTDDHGTHVAGIIGGHDDVIVGAAVGTQLAIMKVFSNNGGGCEEADVLAALEDSIKLDVDVINMSLGSDAGFSRDKDSSRVNEVYDSVLRAGINLVIAAGNDYSSGFGSAYGLNLASNPDSAVVGSPSTYTSGISVASISGIKTNYLVAYSSKDSSQNPVNPLNIYYTVPADNNGEDITFMDRLLVDSSGNAITEKEFEYVVVPGLGTPADYVGLNVSGKIAVVKRGIDTFVSKIEVAQAMGAVACIIRNHVSGIIRMTLGTKPLIPACSIKMDFGNELYDRSRASSAAGQGEGGFMTISREYQAGPFMSDFSSWGPSPNLDMKPEITAHGGDITSAVLGGGYDALSGTSMAAPNFAAVAALLRQHIIEHAADYGVDKNDTVAITALVNQIFMSTATIAVNEDKNPYSPRKQGAGLADLTKSQQTSAYMYVKDSEGNVSDKTKMPLGDDKNRTGEYKLDFYIRNISNQALSYSVNTIVMTEGLSSDEKTVTELPVLLNDASKDVKVTDGGSYNKSKKTVTVNANSDAHVVINVKLSKANKKYLDDTFKNGMFVEGFVELTPIVSGSSAVDLSIPYLAFYGDWTDAPILDKTIYETSPDEVNDSLQDHEKNKPDVKSIIPLAMATQDLGLARGDVEYIFFMGSPVFASADGFQDVAVEMDKSSLSLGEGGMFMLYGISGLIRNAKTVKIKIANTYTGQTMISKAYQNGRKSTGFKYGVVEFNDEIDIKKFMSEEGVRFVEGGKYTFEMECFLDWGDGKTYGNNNKFTFDFYVDSVAPEIKNVDVRIEKDRNFENEKRYIDFEIYDAHYAASMDILYYNQNTERYGSIYTGGMKPLFSERGGTLKTTVDVTDYWQYIVENNYEVMVALSDYAWNTSYKFLNIRDSFNWITNLKFDTRYATNALSISTYEEYDLRNLLTVTSHQTGKSAWDSDYNWRVVNPDHAQFVSVDMGKILGLAPTADPVTIEVSSKTTNAKATIDVVVSETTFGNATKFTPKKLELDNSALTLSTGTNYEITATISPHIITDDYRVVWSSNYAFDSSRDYEEEGIGWVDVVPVETDNPNDLKAIIKVDGVFDEELAGYSRPTIKAVVETFTDGKWVATNVVATCYITIPQTYVVTYHNLDKYNGNQAIVDIPGDLGIEAIGQYAFSFNPFITEVTIPEGVETINQGAFAYCERLTVVNLPASLTTIGQQAFTARYNKDGSGNYISSLTTVNIENTNNSSRLRSVGEKAFFNNRYLTTIDLSMVASIAPQAFFQCISLEEIDLSSCRDVGSAAFYGNSSLERITGFSHGANIGELAFFEAESLVSLDLPVSRIGMAAFYAKIDFENNRLYTELTSVTFSVESSLVIEDYAFAGQQFLTAVDFGDTVVKSIGAYAFADLKITSLTLPDGLEYLGDFAFGYTSIAELTIRSGVKLKEFGETVFTNTNLSRIILQGDSPLYSTNAEGTILYNKDKSAILFVVPNPGQTLASLSFSGVKSIAPYAFAGASLPTEIVLTGVESIGVGAFKGSKGLRTVYYTSTLTSVGNNAFEGTTIATFAVATGSTNNLKSIGSAAFKNTSVNNFVVPAGVTKIAAETFSDTGSLINITFEGNVVEIGDGAFANSAISNIDLSKVVTIGNSAFINCGNLRETNLESATTIGNLAFQGCDLLVVTSLKSAKTIGAHAFAQNKSFTSVSLPEVTFIGDYAFSGIAYMGMSEETEEKHAEAIYSVDALKANLASISMPKVEYIGVGAFRNSNLTTVALPATLKVVSPYAFTDCLNLQRINVDNNNKLFFDEDGVLYGVVPKLYATFATNGTMNGYSEDGSYTLITYPLAKTFAKQTKQGQELNFFKVKMGTVRIEAGAFACTEIEWIDLPFEMRAIGHEAFYACSKLKFVDFHSYDAPALETVIESEQVVVTTSLTHVNAYESYYHATAFYSNFVFDLTNPTDKRPIQVTYPANGVSYNNSLYTSFFETITSTNEIVMATSTENFIRSVMELPELKDMDYYRDEAIVRSLQVTLSLLSEEQKTLFVSSEIVNKLNAAVAWVEAWTPPSKVNVGLIVGLSVGGTVALLGAGAVVFFLKKKKIMG